MAVLTASTLAGCATRYKAGLLPGCRKTETLVLMAQSVPSATMIPCISVLPAGWTFRDIDVRNGLSTFDLDSDRAGSRAVVVELRETCPTGGPGGAPQGSTEIATDEKGARRYEKVESVVDGYRGTRFYVFPGGCVTYSFRFSRQGLALVNEVSLAIGFLPRDEAARLGDVEL
ncbi:MAG: hypothetical protein ACR2HV_10705 [Acidimicrobiales bacterium]